nr:MAG: ORF2 [Torque teno polar bear virus 14]
MLPVHKRWRTEYKRKEALWKRSISSSHAIFCSCPDYRLHFDSKCRFMAEGGADFGVVSPGEGVSFVTEDGTPGGDDVSTGEVEAGR